MNLTLERGPALAALQRVAGVVNRGLSIDILSNIVISASDGSITLRGTDLDMELIESVPAQVSEAGMTTLPADKLLNIARNSDPGAQLVMAMGEAEIRMSVKSGRSRFSVPTLPAASFPQFPFDGFDGEFTMPAKTLADMLERVSFLVDRDEGSAYRAQSCVYLCNHGDQLHAVGASGHGVALRREPNPGVDGLRAIIPIKLLKQIVSLCATSEGDARVAWRGGEPSVSFPDGSSNRSIRVECGSASITGKLFDAPAYVNYLYAIDGVEPRSINVCTDQDALGVALRRAAIMYDGKSTSVRFTFSEGALAVSNINASVGEGEDEIATDYEGEPLKFLINSTYVTSALAAMRGDVLQIGFEAADEQGDASKVLLSAPSDPGFFAMLVKCRA